MRRLTFRVEIAFGKDEPEAPDRETQFDALVERAHPGDVSERSELDHRRPIGFRREAT